MTAILLLAVIFAAVYSVLAVVIYQQTAAADPPLPVPVRVWISLLWGGMAWKVANHGERVVLAITAGAIIGLLTAHLNWWGIG